MSGVITCDLQYIYTCNLTLHFHRTFHSSCCNHYICCVKVTVLLLAESTSHRVTKIRKHVTMHVTIT